MTPNSRSYLTHFSQPDTIIPNEYDPQSLNRYAYARDNPIRYNDPSGHDPFWLGLVSPIYMVAAVVVVALTETAHPIGDNASNIWELMHLGVEHADHANITGAGLQSLENDPSVKGEEDNITALIQSDPKYRNQAYTVPDDEYSKLFTANGPSKNFFTGLLTGNEAFLMVHGATLSNTNTKVSADGTISITWKVDDNFDYLPEWNNHNRSGYHYWAYNIGAAIASPIYYGLLGAEPTLPDNASWNQTIYPPVKNSNKLIPQ